MNSSTTANPPTDSSHFDVRTIPCRVKHAQIFQRWNELPVGAHFVLVNDHDPIPLYHQFSAQFPGAFLWEYLVTGPEVFQVKITRVAASTSSTAAPQKKSAAPIDPQAVFDVRSIPGRVKHAQIFQRWFDLPVGGYFVLLNDHDPIPLRYQFDAEFPQAFTWEYLENGPDEFRVKITKLASVNEPAPAVVPPAPQSASSHAPSASNSSGNLMQIDARGLEPPEPLIRILDALESLPAGFQLRAITDREPCHLFGEAEQRGFRHACTERPDHSWVTVLERA
jgi:uncharacterized protein (DUF2249 family)